MGLSVMQVKVEAAVVLHEGHVTRLRVRAAAQSDPSPAVAEHVFRVFRIEIRVV